ncbi:MAG TPA: Ni/Fe-hydrogenase, b-type cytochrome subunit [Deinococcales bacterium]|nr:Ni/Fe-hydrogenase, b-type cytochrome subunit [Deinococcales bacterium]
MALTGARVARKSRARAATVAPASELDRVAVRYIFSSFVRASHWLRALLLFWFVGSGFYLASPFLAPDSRFETSFNFIQAQVRGWHVLAGWLLVAITLGRMYVFFLRRDTRFSGGRRKVGLGVGDEFRMARILFDLKAWREQLSYYLLISRRHPEHTTSHYGPLQYLVYVGFYAALVLIIVTGLILAGPYQERGMVGAVATFLSPVTVAMGGLANVRSIHHWTMWAIILFSFLHLYMVAWNALRHRSLEVESIITGYRAEREHKS